MDYMQFRKFMDKVGDIEKLLEKVSNIERHVERIANTAESSLEEIKGILLSIDSVVQMYVEGKLKPPGS